MRQISIELPGADPRWEALLSGFQSGRRVGARRGMDLRIFMAEVLGFPSEYIEGSVSTVFLDDKPVDDIDAARLREGSRVALSAAMPGLVGAVMRRKSPYSSFRSGISHRGEEDLGASGGARGGAVGEASGSANGGATGESCTVLIKLFNSVMRDRGRGVLERGILLRGAELAELCASAGLALPERGGETEIHLLRIREAGA